MWRNPPFCYGNEPLGQIDPFKGFQISCLWVAKISVTHEEKFWSSIICISTNKRVPWAFPPSSGYNWPSPWLWICFSDILVYPKLFQFVFMISNFASNELLCRRLRVSLVSDSWDSREWFSHAHRHIWGLIQSAVIIMITAHCSCPFGWCHGCIGSLRITQNIFQFFNNCIYHITFRSWVVWAS